MTGNEVTSIGASTPPQLGHLDGRNFTVKLFPLLHPQFSFKHSAEERVHISNSYLSWSTFSLYRFPCMAFQTHCVTSPHFERRVVLAGDPGIGRSSFLAVRWADKPFLDEPPSFIWCRSSVWSVTDLDLEEVPRMLGSTSTTSKTKRVKLRGRSKLKLINAPLKFYPHLYACATTVVFCFSIADESSFENIKHKVNWPQLTTHLQNMRANL